LSTGTFTSIGRDGLIQGKIVDKLTSGAASLDPVDLARAD